MQRKARTTKPGTAPTTENGTVPPRRVRNGERRPREYLNAQEVEQLMAAARDRAGRSAYAISKELGVAYPTVRAHVKALATA